MNSIIESMIENRIVNELEKQLKEFVDISRENIKVQLKTGYLRLSNVRIKTNALAAFKVPLQVIDGMVNSIAIRIPMRNILNAIWHIGWGTDIEDILHTIGAIGIEIDGVTFAVRPYESFDFHIKADEERKKSLQGKFQAADSIFRNRLNDRALRWNLPYGTNLQDNSTNANVIRIVSTIFTRLLEIHVQHIHIKYNDSISDPESPFQLGILLEDFRYGPCTNVCCSTPTKPSTTTSTTNLSSLPESIPSPGNSIPLSTPRTPSIPENTPNITSSTNTQAFSSSSSSSLLVRSTRDMNFHHKIVVWDGLYVYLIPLVSTNSSTHSKSSSLSSVHSNGTDSPNDDDGDDILYRSLDIPTNIPKDLYIKKLKSLHRWIELDIFALQFIIRDVSGAITLSRHMLKAIVSSDDPPAYGLDIHIDNLHIELRESQFAHLRALSSYGNHVARFARYKLIPRPENKRIPLLTTEQYTSLREYMYACRIRKFYEIAMMKQNAAIHRAKLQEEEQRQHRRHAHPRTTESTTAEEAATSTDEANLTGIIDEIDNDNDTTIDRSSTIDLSPTDGIERMTNDNPNSNPAFVDNVPLSSVLPSVTEMNLPEVPMDPYTLLTENQRQTIRKRALGWWKFAVSCICHDIRDATGIRKTIQDTVRKVELRNRYIKKFREVWYELYGPVIVPPVVLPSFSIISVTRSPLASLTSPSATSATSTGWYNEWVVDVPSESVPPHVVDLITWNKVTGTNLSASSTGNGSSSLPFGSPIRTTRIPHSSNPANEGAALITLSPDDPMYSPPSSTNVLQQHRTNDSTTGTTTNNNNNSNIHIANAVSSTENPNEVIDTKESPALQLIRQFERVLSLDEILQFRLLTETQLITEHTQKLQRQRQKYAMNRAALLARKDSRRTVKNILRAVLHSYVSSTFAGMTLSSTDDKSKSSTILKETLARIVSQQRLQYALPVRLNDLRLPLLFNNSGFAQYISKQNAVVSTSSLASSSSSAAEYGNYYNDFFTYGQSKDIILLTSSYIRNEEDKLNDHRSNDFGSNTNGSTQRTKLSSSFSGSLLSSIKESMHHPKVRNLDTEGASVAENEPATTHTRTRQNNDDGDDDDDDMHTSTFPYLNPNPVPNVSSKTKRKGILKGIRMLFSPSTSGKASSTTTKDPGSAVKKERKRFFGGGKDKETVLPQNPSAHTLRPEEREDEDTVDPTTNGSANGILTTDEEDLWGSEHLMCVSSVVGLWIMFGLHPHAVPSTFPSTFSSSISENTVKNPSPSLIYPTLEPVPIEVFSSTRFTVTTGISSSSSSTSSLSASSTAESTVPFTVSTTTTESSSVPATPVFRYGEPTSLQFLQWYTSQILSSQVYVFQNSLWSQLTESLGSNKSRRILTTTNTVNNNMGSHPLRTANFYYGNYREHDGMSGNDKRVMLDAVIYNNATEEDVGLPLHFISSRLAIHIAQISILIKSQYTVSNIASRMQHAAHRVPSSVHARDTKTILPSAPLSRPLLVLTIEDTNTRIARRVGAYRDIYFNIGTIIIDNPSASKIVPYSYHRLLNGNGSTSNDNSELHSLAMNDTNINLSSIVRMDTNIPLMHALVPKIAIPTAEQLLRNEHWSRHWSLWLQRKRYGSIVNWIKIWQYTSVYTLVDTNRRFDILKDMVRILDEDTNNIRNPSSNHHNHHYQASVSEDGISPTGTTTPVTHHYQYPHPHHSQQRSFVGTEPGSSSTDYIPLPLSVSVKTMFDQLSSYILANAREKSILTVPVIDESTLMTLMFKELSYALQYYTKIYIDQEWCVRHSTFRHQCSMLRRSTCITKYSPGRNADNNANNSFVTDHSAVDDQFPSSTSASLPSYNPCTVLYFRQRLHIPLSLLNNEHHLPNTSNPLSSSSSPKPVNDIYSTTLLSNKQQVLSLQRKLTRFKSMRDTLMNTNHETGTAINTSTNTDTFKTNTIDTNANPVSDDKGIYVPDLYGNWWAKELPYLWSPGKLVPLIEPPKTEHDDEIKKPSNGNGDDTAAKFSSFLWKPWHNSIYASPDRSHNTLILRSSFVAVQVPSVNSLYPLSKGQRNDIRYALSVFPHVFSHADAVLTLRRLQTNQDHTNVHPSHPSLLSKAKSSSDMASSSSTFSSMQRGSSQRFDSHSLPHSTSTGNLFSTASLSQHDNDGTTWIIAEAILRTGTNYIELCGRQSNGQVVPIISIPLNGYMEVLTESSVSFTATAPRSSSSSAAAAVSGTRTEDNLRDHYGWLLRSAVSSTRLTTSPLYFLSASGYDRDEWIHTLHSIIEENRSMEESIRQALHYDHHHHHSYQNKSTNVSSTLVSLYEIEPEYYIAGSIAPMHVTLQPQLVDTLSQFFKRTGSQFELTKRKLYTHHLQSIADLRQQLFNYGIAEEFIISVLPWSVWREGKYNDDVRLVASTIVANQLTKNRLHQLLLKERRNNLREENRAVTAASNATTIGATTSIYSDEEHPDKSFLRSRKSRKNNNVVIVDDTDIIQDMLDNDDDDASGTSEEEEEEEEEVSVVDDNSSIGSFVGLEGLLEADEENFTTTDTNENNGNSFYSTGSRKGNNSTKPKSMDNVLYEGMATNAAVFSSSHSLPRSGSAQPSVTKRSFIRKKPKSFVKKHASATVKRIRLTTTERLRLDYTSATPKRYEINLVTQGVTIALPIVLESVQDMKNIVNDESFTLATNGKNDDSTVDTFRKFEMVLKNNPDTVDTIQPMVGVTFTKDTDQVSPPLPHIAQVVLTLGNCMIQTVNPKTILSIPQDPSVIAVPLGYADCYEGIQTIITRFSVHIQDGITTAPVPKAFVPLFDSTTKKVSTEDSDTDDLDTTAENEDRVPIVRTDPLDVSLASYPHTATSASTLVLSVARTTAAVLQTRATTITKLPAQVITTDIGSVRINITPSILTPLLILQKLWTMTTIHPSSNHGSRNDTNTVPVDSFIPSPSVTDNENNTGISDGNTVTPSLSLTNPTFNGSSSASSTGAATVSFAEIPSNHLVSVSSIVPLSRRRILVGVLADIHIQVADDPNIPLGGNSSHSTIKNPGPNNTLSKSGLSMIISVGTSSFRVLQTLPLTTITDDDTVTRVSQFTLCSEGLRMFFIDHLTYRRKFSLPLLTIRPTNVLSQKDKTDHGTQGTTPVHIPVSGTDDVLSTVPRSYGFQIGRATPTTIDSSILPRILDGQRNGNTVGVPLNTPPSTSTSLSSTTVIDNDLSIYSGSCQLHPQLDQLGELQILMTTFSALVTSVDKVITNHRTRSVGLIDNWVHYLEQFEQYQESLLRSPQPNDTGGTTDAINGAVSPRPSDNRQWEKYLSSTVVAGALNTTNVSTNVSTTIGSPPSLNRIASVRRPPVSRMKSSSTKYSSTATTGNNTSAHGTANNSTATTGTPNGILFPHGFPLHPEAVSTMQAPIDPPNPTGSNLTAPGVGVFLPTQLQQQEISRKHTDDTFYYRHNYIYENIIDITTYVRARLAQLRVLYNLPPALTSIDSSASATHGNMTKGLTNDSHSTNHGTVITRTGTRIHVEINEIHCRIDQSVLLVPSPWDRNGTVAPSVASINENTFHRPIMDITIRDIRFDRMIDNIHNHHQSILITGFGIVHPDNSSLTLSTVSVRSVTVYGFHSAYNHRYAMHDSNENEKGKGSTDNHRRQQQETVETNTAVPDSRFWSTQPYVTVVIDIDTLLLYQGANKLVPYNATDNDEPDTPNENGNKQRGDPSGGNTATTTNSNGTGTNAFPDGIHALVRRLQVTTEPNVLSLPEWARRRFYSNDMNMDNPNDTGTNTSKSGKTTDNPNPVPIHIMNKPWLWIPGSVHHLPLVRTILRLETLKRIRNGTVTESTSTNEPYENVSSATPLHSSTEDDAKNHSLRTSIPLAEPKDIIQYFHDTLFSWKPITATVDKDTTKNDAITSNDPPTTSNLILPISISLYTFPRVPVAPSSILTNDSTSGSRRIHRSSSIDPSIDQSSTDRTDQPKQPSLPSNLPKESSTLSSLPYTLGGADTFTRIETGGLTVEADPLCLLTLLEWVDDASNALVSVTKASSSSSTPSSVSSGIDVPEAYPSSSNLSNTSVPVSSSLSRPVWAHIGAHIPQGIVRLYAIGNGIISEAGANAQLQHYSQSQYSHPRNGNTTDPRHTFIPPSLCNGIVIPHSEILFGGLYVQNDTCKQILASFTSPLSPVSTVPAMVQLINTVMHVRAVYVSIVDLSPLPEDVLDTTSSSEDVLRLIDTAWVIQENEGRFNDRLEERDQPFGSNRPINVGNEAYDEWNDRIYVLSEGKSLALQLHNQRTRVVSSGTFLTDNMNNEKNNSVPVIDLTTPLPDVHRPWRVLLAPIPINRVNLLPFINIHPNVPLPSPSLGFSSGGSTIHGFRTMNKGTNTTDNHTVRTSKSRVQFVSSNDNGSLPVPPSEPTSSGQSVSGRSVGTYHTTLRSNQQQLTNLLTAVSSEQFLPIPSWFLLRASARTVSHTGWLSNTLASTYNYLNPIVNNSDSDGEGDEGNDQMDARSYGTRTGNTIPHPSSFPRHNAVNSSSSSSSVSFLSPDQKSDYYRQRASTTNTSSQIKIGIPSSSSSNSQLLPQPFQPHQRRYSSSNSMVKSNLPASVIPSNSAPSVKGSRSVRTARDALSAVRGSVSGRQSASSGSRAPFVASGTIDSSTLDIFSSTNRNPNIPSGYLLHRYFTLPSMLMVTLTYPFKYQTLSDDAMMDKMYRNQAKTLAIAQFGQRVLEAEQKNEPIPTPLPNTIDMTVSSHMRIWLKDCSFVYFKRWLDETKGITATLKAPLEKENVWLASFLPRLASFDHTVTDITNTRIILPSSSQKADKAIIVMIRAASTRNQLLYVLVNSLSSNGGNENNNIPMSMNGTNTDNVFTMNNANKAPSGGYSSVRRNSSAGYKDTPFDNRHTNETTNTSTAGTPPTMLGSMITVPLERTVVEAIGVDFAIAEGFRKRLSTTTNNPKLPGMPPHFSPLPDVTLSSIVDLNEGSAWLAACTAVQSGTANPEAAIISIPLLQSIQIGTGTSLRITLDNPTGSAYRSLSPILSLSDISITNGFDVSGLVENITLIQDIQKQNTKETGSLLHLLPDLQLPGITHMHLSTPSLRIRNAEVAQNRRMIGTYTPKSYIVDTKKTVENQDNTIGSNSTSTDNESESGTNSVVDVPTVQSLVTNKGLSKYRPPLTTATITMNSLHTEAIHILRPLLQSLLDPHGLPTNEERNETETKEGNRTHPGVSSSTSDGILVSPLKLKIKSRTKTGMSSTTSTAINPWIGKMNRPIASLITPSSLGLINQVLTDYLSVPKYTTNLVSTSTTTTPYIRTDPQGVYRSRLHNTIQQYGIDDTLDRISKVLQLLSSTLASDSTGKGMNHSNYSNSTNNDTIHSPELFTFLSLLVRYTSSLIEQTYQEKEEIISQQNVNIDLLVQYIQNQRDNIQLLTRSYSQVLLDRTKGLYGSSDGPSYDGTSVTDPSRMANHHTSLYTDTVEKTEIGTTISHAGTSRSSLPSTTTTITTLTSRSLLPEESSTPKILSDHSFDNQRIRSLENEVYRWKMFTVYILSGIILFFAYLYGYSKG